MAEQEMVNATRTDVDDMVFSAAEDIAENTPGLSRRERMKMALAITDSVMHNIDQLSETAKRSEAGKKAAATRYSKPKPGPAIPPPAPEPAQIVRPPDMAAAGQNPNVPLPPPPHPALMPQGAASPFGNAPT